MKEYEAVWEIFNQCANNQMRDVFIEEVRTEDPKQYVMEKFKGRDVRCEETVLEDGTIDVESLYGRKDILEQS